MTLNLMDGATDDNLDVDPNKNYLTELVGEGKKFKSPEELAKGKAASDLYIKQMERRIDEMRQDYLKLREEHNAGPKLQELIDKLAQKQHASSENTLDANDVNNTAPVFDTKQIESLVSSKIQELETSKRQQENYRSVQEKLIERFGPNYKTHLKQHIDELGITDEFANNLALTAPKVFMKTIGLDQPQKREGFQAPPRSEERRDNFSPTAGHKRTWSYYQQMKKENPTLYYDPKTLVQITKDAVELGDAFEDGNFHAR
jgi:hypothetical protein